MDHLWKKTKEIKSLSGDFKNTVNKEIDGTRRSVRNLHEACRRRMNGSPLPDVAEASVSTSPRASCKFRTDLRVPSITDASATSGKGDPFILRLHVEKQVEKQIEEENYLHRVEDTSISIVCFLDLAHDNPLQFTTRILQVQECL
jgi:hypothetical protein